MDKMKGLSPIVATVILIAFAVAIGGLVAVWLTNFTDTTTGFTGQKGSQLTNCAGIGLKIESVTDGGIIYSNPGSNTITNITAFDMNGRNLTYNLSSLGPANVGNITWSRGANTSIFMKGLCQTNVPVEGACQSGQSCWK